MAGLFFPPTGLQWWDQAGAASWALLFKWFRWPKPRKNHARTWLTSNLHSLHPVQSLHLITPP